mmetsp:Transcript_8458/g.20030  ORF Transcript_8458/g.20030 Transcript_8458/m.20030 type:complete len:86 (-) Transcript_8458:471-728(-)
MARGRSWRSSSTINSSQTPLSRYDSDGHIVGGWSADEEGTMLTVAALNAFELHVSSKRRIVDGENDLQINSIELCDCIDLLGVLT